MFDTCDRVLTITRGVSWVKAERCVRPRGHAHAHMEAENG